ncbi:hypothetical protein ACCO45_000628 [Purpureocillium lilacinum]|uniref:Uncharacterized protein n=1 Tax=Purpureocillium lilacinum TaxID=33203 RepID=A0ACC4E661_PURLI
MTMTATRDPQAGVDAPPPAREAPLLLPASCLPYRVDEGAPPGRAGDLDRADADAEAAPVAAESAAPPAWPPLLSCGWVGGDDAAGLVF